MGCPLIIFSVHPHLVLHTYRPPARCTGPFFTVYKALETPLTEWPTLSTDSARHCPYEFTGKQGKHLCYR